MRLLRAAPALPNSEVTNVPQYPVSAEAVDNSGIKHRITTRWIYPVSLKREPAWTLPAETGFFSLPSLLQHPAGWRTETLCSCYYSKP